jgi:dCMP deaminase
MIIGLTGLNAAGKGAVARFLQSCGFAYHSLSDVIRDVLTQRGETSTRENMIKAGNEIRKAGGAEALASTLLKRINPGQNTVVDSFRNPAEVVVFQKHGGFVLLEVKAPEKVRFERLKMRGRFGDPVDRKSFRVLEKKELDGDPEAQQLVATAKLADYKVSNAGTLEELHEKLEPMVRKILQSRQRPAWDDYFMQIARKVAERSNCMKRRVGAIIVNNRRIISTGYNGTPRGALNCNEGGCERCNSLAPSGTRLGECLCSHAEENAITQSAYHGTSVADSTIYVTLSPCLMCTKMIINSGMKEVVYNADYPLGESAIALLKTCGVTVRQFEFDSNK